MNPVAFSNVDPLGHGQTASDVWYLDSPGSFTGTNEIIVSFNGNNWVATADSGPPVLGTAKSGSFGALVSGALESSNVDLTGELVNMMTAQRAYQANAQTIKTQDQVFSTLVNLR